jgi:hypothetical protein
MHYILKNNKNKTKKKTRPGRELGKSGPMPSLTMQRPALRPTTLGPSMSLFFFKFKPQILQKKKKMIRHLTQPRIQPLWWLKK